MKKNNRLLLIVAAIVFAVFFFCTERTYAAGEPNYLTFTAQEDESNISFEWFSGGDVQYKLNEDEWTNYEVGTDIILKYKDNKVSFKGKNVTTNGDNHFSMSGKIAASGSVTSLTDENGSDSEVTLGNVCYSYMFDGCTSLTTAPELPSTKLKEGCYYEMFSGCTSLTTAPELPATKMADFCYSLIFSGCTSLTEAPELPATELANGCYDNMFSGCTSLTEAPELPATELASSCYNRMFNGCTSLTEAPKLPATKLAVFCYYEMFRECISLTTAPELPATKLAGNCYSYMFNGCTHLLISKEKIPEKFITTEYILPDSEEFECYKGIFSAAGTESGIPSEIFPNSTPTAGTYYTLTNEFNIQYNLDGGTNASSNPSSYRYGTGVASFATPTKAGYKFDGWYTDAGFTKKITSIAKDVRGDYTLYAKWIKEKVSNTITVKDFSKDYSTKAQKIKLGAKVKGGAKLTYKSNNKKVKVDGKGTVTIPKNFCGIVKITITSAETDAYLKATATSTITVTSAKTKINKISASKKALTIKWTKVKNADGYEITYSTNKNFTKAKKLTAKKTATSATIKKLTSKKKYYVKMRSYKKSGGKKIYSHYCAVKSVKVK